MKQFLFTLSFTLLFINLFAQSPQGFNYQAVARDGDGKLIANKSLQIKATIYSGLSGSSMEYQETHGVSTNSNGLFSLVIGEGSVVSGQFDQLKWGDKSHHVQIEIDAGNGFVVMGKVKLQSVPYAIYAGSAGGNVDDADADPKNEIQQLTISGSKISLTDGGSIDLPVNGDNSSTNEIQVLSLSNDTLYLSGGGYAVLPSSNASSYIAGEGIEFKGDTISTMAGSNIWNADKIQNNDISTKAPSNKDVLQFDGFKWSPAAASNISPWNKVGNDIQFDENVGIGIKTPTSRFHVFDSVDFTGSGTVMSQNVLHGGTDVYRYWGQSTIVQGHGGGENIAGLFFSIDDVNTNGGAKGVYAVADGDGAINYAVQGISGENGRVQNYGVVGVSNGLGTFNMGLYGQASRSHSNTNYGVYASTDSASTQYAGYFVGNVNYTGTLTNASDMKLKRDINNLSGALNIIDSLQPKTYYFRNDGDASYMSLPKHLQFGFLAQDLEKTVPNLVHTQKQIKTLESGEGIEYKGVDYISLIPVLTQAIKEQQEMIEKLQLQVEYLENKISDEK